MTVLLLALKLTILFAVANLVSLGLRNGRASTISPRVEMAVLPIEPSALVVTPAATTATDAFAAVGAFDDITVLPSAARPQPAQATTIAWVPVVWSGGAVIVLLLVGMSWLATARLARRATPVVSGVLHDELEQARSTLGIRRRVRLLMSHDHAMPMTWGARRPVVLLPSEAVDWPAERRRDVLIHELGHVRRLDWLSQLGSRVVCAAYWWHPLAWQAARRLREERELACDDLVLTQGTDAAEYAHHLLAIAKHLRTSPATALATVAMARPSQLAGRLLAVLDGTRQRAGITKGSAGAATVTAALVLLPLAGLTAVAARPAAPADPPVAPPAATDVAPPNESPALASIPAWSPNTLCRWDRNEERSSSTHMNSDHDRVTVRISLDDCELSVRSRGLVRFSADEREVAELGKRHQRGVRRLGLEP